MSASFTTTQTPAAGLAFDALADGYDEKFTNSLIGRAQRDVVWDVLDRTFSSRRKDIGTELWHRRRCASPGRLGVSVVGCDASARMVDVARRKFAAERFPWQRRPFTKLASEHINEIAYRAPFDGVFSNFAGLNCVQISVTLPINLLGLVRPGGHRLLCLCSRTCVLEILYLRTSVPMEAGFAAVVATRACGTWDSR